MSAGSMPRVWTVVELEVPARHEDELLALLAPGTLGAEVVSAAGPRTRLRLYVEGRRGAAALARRAAGWLERYGVTGAVPTVSSVPDGRWLEIYQRRLSPFPLGRRFVVQPGDDAPPAGPRRTLRIVPGQAFGTGEHATTQLAAVQLEQRVVGGARWLDVGCGTAILALVARLCGAGRVRAIDIDPLALDVAERVVRANGLSDGIELAEGGIERETADVWDGVVVNISSTFLVERAHQLAALLRPAGSLVASGFLIDEFPAVTEALRVSGFEELERDSRAGWGALAARRGAG